MIIKVHLTPNAKQTSIEKVTDFFGETIWKIKVTAKPVDWEANKALIAFLSDELWVAKMNIHLAKWAKSRNKIIQIDWLEECAEEK